MPFKFFRSILLTLLAAIALLAACRGGTDESYASDGTDPQAANFNTIPALNSMEYCEKLGYTTEARQNTDCENFFVCIFPDGTECNSGLFQQGSCGEDFTYCAQQGYDVSVVDFVVRCNFPDGSFCTELDYLLGECQPGEVFP